MDSGSDEEMVDVEFDVSSDVVDDDLPSLSDLEEEESDYEDATGELRRAESEVESESADSDSSSSSSSVGIDAGAGAGPWIRVADVDSDAPRVNHRFNKRRRVLANVRADSNPLDFVKVFLTNEFWERIITFTRSYARKTVDDVTAREQARGREGLPPRSRFRQWEKVSQQLGVGLLVAFFGLFLNMGLIKKASLADYWNSTDWSQQTPAFPEVMSRDRFLLLLRLIQFYDVDVDDNPDDPGRKIRYVFDYLNARFTDAYVPGEFLTVDEGLVGFRGRAGIIQYMPAKKHHKFGIKSYELCEKNGYTLMCSMCAGSEDRVPDAYKAIYPNRPDAIVRRLLENFGNSWWHVTTDNWYSHVTLFSDMHERKIKMTGTVRKNRTAGIPEAVKKARNPAGSATASRKGQMLAISYRQKASQKQPGVILISTSETAKWVNEDGNHVRVAQKNDKSKPQIVHKYNHTKMGVDLADQKMYEYEVERKSRRWTVKVAMRLIQKALLNAYLLYSMLNDDPMPRKKFYIAVIEAMCGTERLARLRGVGPPDQPGPSQKRRRRGCEMQRLPKGKKRDCSICSDRANEQRKRTNRICSLCNVGVCPDCWDKHDPK